MPSRPTYTLSTLRRAGLWRCFALVIACNYFAFRTELIERENDENHPQHYSTLSITLPSLNWETFDKDNAPKALTIAVALHIDFLFNVHSVPNTPKVSFQPFQPVRDKSPPSLCSL